MTGRLPRRNLAAALIIVVAVLSGATSVGHAAPVQQAEGEARVRDLEFRSRDIGYRWRALDNSERVAETGGQTTVTFAADVLFEFDQAVLTPAAAARLDELAAQLTDGDARTLSIAGHTDSVGEPAYNQSLSEQRAEAVRSALASRLGGDFTFQVAGYGETQPVAPNENPDGSDNPAGRALNRRVDIQFPTA